MTAIRIAIGVVIAAIVLVSLVPMVAVLDLAAGGDGLGLCPDGVSSCRTSYFDGPELLGMLVVILLLLMMILRALFHVRRLLDAQRVDDALDPVEGGHERFGGRRWRR